MLHKMTLIREVRELTKQEFIKSGMHFKNGVFLVELANDVLGWVGLNEATKYTLRINPKVGVRNEAVERLIFKLRNKDLSEKHIHPTVSTNVGYIMPFFKTYRTWYFYDGKDYRQKVKRMVEVINKHGRRFMESNVSLEVLAKSIIKYEGREHFLFRLPVVYYLMNKPKLAKGFILKELKKLGDIC